MTQLPHRFLRTAFREALGHDPPPPGGELRRLRLLQDPVRTLPLGRVEDPALPEPERDVVGGRRRPDRVRRRPTSGTG